MSGETYWLIIFGVRNRNLKQNSLSDFELKVSLACLYVLLSIATKVPKAHLISLDGFRSEFICL